MTSTKDKRAAFRALHEGGCFVIPNPWDAGSARMLQHLGFKALASTSAGFAWTAGQPDYRVSRAAALGHLALLSAAVELPVNADFESGFAATPEGVVESVRLAVQAGVSGLSIEDRDLERGRLYDTAIALERLEAARSAIADALLVARTEILLIAPDEITRAIDSLVAFAAAGADCLYAPGVRKREDIAAMARAVAPKPLNVLAIDPTMTLAELRDLGVRRISVGGSLARVGWAATVAAAKEMMEGSFAPLAKGMPSKELNGVFAGFSE
ncbi:MAG: isocitrate lyase/phosphoenolpyruvate mutase family protein [Rhodoblastus sp.]|nr:isocitrate lyase/phosphoenolpyruvate mutase family protein [Rhodoblastus sp.]